MSYWKNLPKKTLEIGFGRAASALLFLNYHKTEGHQGHCHYAIDLTVKERWGEAGVILCERAGLRDRLNLFIEPSEIKLPKLLAAGDKFDFIYVDGSHLQENVFIDAFYSTRLLKMGGFILFDDASSKGVSRVIQFLRTLAHSLEEIDLSLLSKRSTPYYKSAKILGRVQIVAFRKIGTVQRSYFDY